MNQLYTAFVRPALFSQDPEVIHERTLAGLQRAERLGSLPILRRFYPPPAGQERLRISRFGLEFPNPIGIAAGLDKNAKVYNSLFAFGFGFVECGTVTPRPQPGNEPPRLFRLLEDEALINRLGFNNEGQEMLASRVRRKPPQGILGINIGKNKVTPNEQAPDDYRMVLRAVWDVAAYIVVNVSSPNTPNLRELQEKAALQQLLSVVFQTADELQGQRHRSVPILLKIAPDLTDEALQDLLTVVRAFPLQGLIATNTTLRREGLRSSQSHETGGMSGKPLRDPSTAIIRTLFDALGHSLPIVGVGGVYDGESAYEKIRAGACLLELYTSLVYRGPGVANQIQQELLQLLDRDGFARLEDAVGADKKSS
jgi:dihydroorotate dehydrogenase